MHRATDRTTARWDPDGIASTSSPVIDDVAAHALRTPLTSIVGCFEFLASGRGELTDQQRAIVDMGQRNASRLRATIERLTDECTVPSPDRVRSGS